MGTGWSEVRVSLVRVSLCVSLCPWASVLPKDTTQCRRSGLEAAPLDPETRTLTTQEANAPVALGKPQ